MTEIKCEVEEKENGLLSKHNHKLFCKYWKPVLMESEKPKHLIFICHGVAEHCQTKRYNEIATLLVQHGNYVFSHDHVGHGKSEGDRVHVNDFYTYVDDVIDHIEKVQKDYKDVPCFIFGHSMGGLIAILAAMKVPDVVKGLILSGPALSADKKIATPFKIFCAKIAGSIFPQYQIGAILPELICRDKEVCRLYEEDALVWHGGMKAKLCCCMLAAMNEAESRMSELKTPFLLVHGSADQICNVEGSKMMHEKAGSQDKTFKVYEGGYHAVFSEIEGQGEQVVNDIIEWVNNR